MRIQPVIRAVMYSRDSYHAAGVTNFIRDIQTVFAAIFALACFTGKLYSLDPLNGNLLKKSDV